MTDEIVAKGYADLISDDQLGVPDADAVARELQDHGDGWLVAEKGVATVDPSDNVIGGIVEHETEKAYLVVTGGDEVWLPKSVVTVYRAADGAEFSVPQHGITDFGEGGESA